MSLSAARALLRRTLLTTSLLCLISAVAAAGPRMLIYSATADFRHDSIPTAVQALQNASATINVEFDHTEDKTLFTDENLANYDALLFLMNTGESKRPYSSYICTCCG
jgi:hypothetical protein